jgi:hypothetical protein
MKTSRLYIYIILNMALCNLMFGQAVVPVEQSGKFSFQAANVNFKIDPSFGARISSFKVGSKEILYPSQSAGDYLWGSTFWQSPQIWPWPPSATLDKNPYSGGITDNKVILRSGLDASSHLIFKKTFSASLSDTSITIEYAIINKASGNQSFASWEVTRVPSGGISFFPMGEGEVTGAFANQTENIDDIVWYEHSNSDPGSQKYFCDGLEGWSAYVNEDSILFIKKFTDAAYESRANGENEIELWHNSTTSYIELENQSEYSSIPAGDSVSWNMKWYARKLPSGISVEKGNSELVDLVRNIVTQVPPNANPNISDSKPVLYPNPAGNYVVLSNLPALSTRFALYDICGKQVLNKYVKNNDHIELTGLQSNIYFYKIGELNTATYGKLIINK